MKAVCTAAAARSIYTPFYGGKVAIGKVVRRALHKAVLHIVNISCSRLEGVRTLNKMKTVRGVSRRVPAGERCDRCAHSH